MPTYEFKCPICLSEVEVLLPHRNSVSQFCINCNNQEMKKIPSLPAIKFNGSGFYETDYKVK